jgi:PAS domain S-box-containing protein
MTAVDELLLEKLNTLIVVINNDGKIEYAGKSVKQMLGYSPEYVSGRNWWIFAGDTKKERRESLLFVNSLMKMNPEISSFTFERKIISGSGSPRWIRWNLSRNDEHTLIGIGYDITATKETEERLKESNELLRKKNEEITDSIEYAQRLQQSFLPDIRKLKNVFSDAFVLYQPKDLLSGDFYWYHQTEEKTFVFVIDCTGHGVPGALMSVLAHSIVKEVVLNKKIESPAEILHAIDEELFHSLQNHENEEMVKDGMDVAVAVFDFKKNKVSFSGAFRPMMMIRNGKLMEFPASRYPIGFYQDIRKDFEEFHSDIKTGDQFYLFTDGYADQFGGDPTINSGAKKLNKKRFSELLLTACDMEGEEQSSFLAYAHNNWKQQEEQTDDVLVLGVII